MASYQRVKGTQDFYGVDIKKMRIIENTARTFLDKYQFTEIKTPIFEHTEVFARSVGDESDIVSKEMYTFLDKGNRSITLRPEGTAAVVRSFLENKLYASPIACTKWYYVGPMFRYERPQAGRFREFNQFGVEAFGVDSPLLDADIIASAYFLLQELKIEQVKLKINSLGDFASRNAYAKALHDYFSHHIDTMCHDCKRRLASNPLRILDCKVDAHTKTMKSAPKMQHYLSEESKKYFEEVCQMLDLLKIDYLVDDNLVRGLDYYTDTVFEFIIESDDALNGLAICAGGKYATLVSSFGGPNMPGIGYAFGMERLSMIKTQQNSWGQIDTTTDVVVIGLDEASKREALRIANILRVNQISCEVDYKNTTLKSQFKLAERLEARFIMIIGEEERLNNVVTIKDVKNNTQIQVTNDTLLKYIEELFL